MAETAYGTPEHRLSQCHTGSRHREGSRAPISGQSLWKPDWGFLAHVSHSGSMLPLLLGPFQPSQTLDAQDTPEVTPVQFTNQKPER